jgi:hypothetical protein
MVVINHGKSCRCLAKLATLVIGSRHRREYGQLQLPKRKEEGILFKSLVLY